MKIAAALLLLAISCQQIHGGFENDFKQGIVQNFASRAIGDKIKFALEALKKIMKSGNATMGIPVLDPFAKEYHKLDIDLEALILKGIVNDVLVNDLSDYSVEFADFKIAKWNMTLDLLWNNIKGKTEYDVDGYLLNKIPIYGAGDLDLEVSSFRFFTQIKLKADYKTKKVSVVNFSATNIAIGAIKAKITGLYNDNEISQLISAVISDVTPDILANFQEEILVHVHKILLPVVNQVMDRFTLDDIMSMIH